MSTRSVNTQRNQQQQQRQLKNVPQQNVFVRPKHANAITEPTNSETRSKCGRYALVPLEDLPPVSVAKAGTL
ncbi:unnamed protein product [Ceratitis capitata]|uniref:(Mediterranean fruit fly) hypothetical protein n=1 Tax=Ceratitis capitata TaxID=7213 RepID=A0A811U4T1_CERCA|nr:unnamed protein product [Ceratitis capitata]